MEEILGMSNKEIERLKVLSEVIEGKITQNIASKKLKISERQVRRLIKGIKKEGNKAVISKKRGKPSNRVPNLEIIAIDFENEILREQSCRILVLCKQMRDRQAYRLGVIESVGITLLLFVIANTLPNNH